MQSWKSGASKSVTSMSKKDVVKKEAPMDFDSDDDDAVFDGPVEEVDEAKFMEEVQLVIAKHGLPGTSANGGPAAFQEVLWIGKAATGINVLFERRIRYELGHLERRMIKKIKGQMGAELKRLKTENEELQRKVEGMDANRSQLLSEIAQKDREVVVLRVELVGAQEEALNLKLEREKKAQKYAEAEGIILKERGMREQADATCKELTISSGAIREINERLKKETEEAVASARIAQQENVRLKEDKVEMRDNFDSERSELSSVLTIFRQERKKEFSVLEAELRKEMEVMEAEAQDLRLALDECEEDLKEECARASELELALYDAQCELNESRDRIIEIARASVKIGHFSMRTGGGWEKVGDAWSKVHAWVASTHWGRDAGLTPEFFSAKDLNSSQVMDHTSLNVSSVRARTPRTPRAMGASNAATTPRTNAATPRNASTAGFAAQTPRTARGGVTPRGAVSPRRTPGAQAWDAAKATTPRSRRESLPAREMPAGRSSGQANHTMAHYGDAERAPGGEGRQSRLAARSGRNASAAAAERGPGVKSASARLAARSSNLALESPPTSPSPSSRRASPPTSPSKSPDSPSRFQRSKHLKAGGGFELMEEGMDCTQLVQLVGVLWGELAGGGVDVTVLKVMLDRLSPRLREAGETASSAQKIMTKLQTGGAEITRSRLVSGILNYGLTTLQASNG